MFKIIHHRERCIGCYACVEIAFQRWRMSKRDGKATLIGAKEKKNIFLAEAADHELEENLKAAEACPVKIIQIVQNNTN